MKPTEENKKETEKLMTELEILAIKPHSLSKQEANQIVNDLGRIIAFLYSCYLFPLAKPISLLPREKKVVLEALAVCFGYTEPDTEDRHRFYSVYFMVKVDFIEDEKAVERNHNLISSPVYWKAIRENKQP